MAIASADRLTEWTGLRGTTGAQSFYTYSIFINSYPRAIDVGPGLPGSSYGDEGAPTADVEASAAASSALPRHCLTLLPERSLG